MKGALVHHTGEAEHNRPAHETMKGFWHSRTSGDNRSPTNNRYHTARPSPVA